MPRGTRNRHSRAPAWVKSEPMPERARMAIAGAAASIALLILIWFAVFHIGFVQRADASILKGFGDLANHPGVNSVASFIAGLCNPKPVSSTSARSRSRLRWPAALVGGAGDHGDPARRKRHHAAAQAAAGRAAPGPARSPMSPSGSLVAERPRHRRDVAGAVHGDRRAGPVPAGWRRRSELRSRSRSATRS